MDYSELKHRILVLEQKNLNLRVELDDAMTNTTVLKESLTSHVKALKNSYIEIMASQEKIRKSEAKYKNLALYDSLTGLPNGFFFKEKLARAIFDAKKGQYPLAVLFIDLDRFKEVNDRCGHEVGDEVLRETGSRIAACVRDSDTVARLGGDGFVILLETMSEHQSVEIIARRILAIMARPITVQGDSFLIGTSIGISQHPFDGDDAKTLIKNADAAMYKVKNNGRNSWTFYREVAQKTILVSII